MSQAPFERLSEGQRICLRLVWKRLRAKEIAQELGIAESTVNARLLTARNLLGVTSSMRAARLLAEHEQAPMHYSSLSYHESPIEPEAPTELVDPPNEHGSGQPLLPLPFPTQRRPFNDLTIGLKLGYVVILAAMIALMFGGGAATLAALSQIF